MSESSQSEKTLEVKTEEEFSRNTRRPLRIVKWPMWMTSGDYILLSACTATAGDGDLMSYWEDINSAQEEEWVTAMKEETDALV
jgi:translation initiation factor IF-1